MIVTLDVCEECGQIGHPDLGHYHHAPAGHRTVRCRGRVVGVEFSDNGDSPIPALAGIAEAADILGVSKAGGIQRLRESGRMPVPVAELRIGPIYRRSDLEALGRELATERAARQERRAEREAAA